MNSFQTTVIVLLFVLIAVVMYTTNNNLMHKLNDIQNEIGVKQEQIDNLIIRLAECSQHNAILQDQNRRLTFRNQQLAIRDVTATAYTMAEGNGDGFTSTMTIPKVGRTLAVSPSLRGLLGKKLKIHGYGVYLAEDEMSPATEGDKVDILFGNIDSALDFGRRELTLSVLWDE